MAQLEPRPRAPRGAPRTGPISTLHRRSLDFDPGRSPSLGAPRSTVLDHRLPSGLDVSVREVPHLHTVKLGLFFRHGSQHEDRGTNGIAHFIEHIAFNPRYMEGPVGGSLHALLDAGATYDAFTSKEYTRLMMTCLPEQLDAVLEVMGRVAARRRVRPEALDEERPLVLQEHATTFSSARRIHDQLVDHALWGDRGNGLFVIGRRENLARFTPQEIEDRLRRYYAPSRATLVLTGPGAGERTLSRVETSFGAWRDDAPPGDREHPEPRHGTALYRSHSTRADVTFAYSGPGFESDRRHAMELLADILGGGIRSRLFLELRERRKLAYLVQGQPTTYSGGGYVALRINCDPERVAEVERLTRAQIESLLEHGPRPGELARVQGARVMRLLEAADNPTRYLQLAGRRIVLGEAFSVEAEARRILSVSLEEVHDVTREVFGAGRRVVLGLGLTEEQLAAIA